MVRGTLANIRLRNQLAPGTEGGWTTHIPSGEKMSIYDAAMRYQREGVGLLILAGKEYGSGSSRDWAAKGVRLLGVRAVIAESFERIHRSNLVGMGVLPLEFLPGENRATLGLTGSETYSVRASGRRWRLAARHGARGGRRRRRRRSSRSTCAWTRRGKPTTTATAAFCRTCCGNWRAGPVRGYCSSKGSTRTNSPDRKGRLRVRPGSRSQASNSGFSGSSRIRSCSQLSSLGAS